MLVQPVIGPVVNGKQSVALNCKDGTARQVISTPEKVDEFLRKRRNNCTDGFVFSLMGIGGLAGAALSYLAKQKSASMLGMSAFLGAVTGFFSAACVAGYRNDKLEQKFIEANT